MLIMSHCKSTNYQSSNLWKTLQTNKLLLFFCFSFLPERSKFKSIGWDQARKALILSGGNNWETVVTQNKWRGQIGGLVQEVGTSLGTRKRGYLYRGWGSSGSEIGYCYRIDKIRKYIKDNGHLISHCWKRELQLWKWRKLEYTMWY